MSNNLLSVALTRSLLNNKGAKIVFSTNYYEGAKHCLRNFALPLKRIYGADVSIKTIPLLAKNWHFVGDGHKTEQWGFELITIQTNPLARKKASLDLRLLNAFDKADFYKRKVDAAILAKRFGVLEKEVKESISRLEQLLINVH